MKTEKKRILSRTLAREIPLEDLGLVQGSTDDNGDFEQPINSVEIGGPVVSTLVATLPSYKEDQ